MADIEATLGGVTAFRSWAAANLWSCLTAYMRNDVDVPI